MSPAVTVVWLLALVGPHTVGSKAACEERAKDINAHAHYEPGWQMKCTQVPVTHGVTPQAPSAH